MNTEKILELESIRIQKVQDIECVLYKDIPDDIKSIFNDWIVGQTVMSNDAGEIAIYIRDWNNFLNYLRCKHTFWD